MGNRGTLGRGMARLGGKSAVAGSLLLAVLGQDALAASSSALSEEPIPMVTEQKVKRSHVESALPEEHGEEAGGHESSALSEEPKPIVNGDEVLPVTPPVLTLGDPFLAVGNIAPGITLPTGAVWQPALWVFGDYRGTLGYFNDGINDGRSYFANRLDLFLNLKLSPTERVLLGFSPLSEGSRSTGFFHTRTDDQFVNATNVEINQLFFEGEFGEIFPRLAPDDNKGLDIGFSFGRQQLLFQDGIMINDTMDSFGVTRDTIMIPGITQDIRITGLFGFNDIRRDDNQLDDSAYLFGIFTETDLRKSTIDLDAAYVLSDSPRGGDALYLGASATQRFGLYNTTFSINSSTTFENEGAAADDGVLLFSQISRTLPYSENIVYADFFWGIDNYSSAARDRGTGGPLGRVGILFAAPAVGFASPALSNRADDAFGGAIGHQMFFNHEKTQVTVEVAGRKDTNNVDQGAVAIGGQLLHALNNRSSVQLDAAVSGAENRDIGSSVRMELRTRF